MPRLAPLLLLVSLAACLRSGPVTSHQATNAIPLQARLDAFEQVWSTIDTKYYDPTFKGLNWGDVRVRYRSAVLGTEDSEPFHAILNDMVQQIPDSHLSVTPPPKAEATHIASRAGVGVELTTIGDEVIVTATEPEGPAALAGIRPGDRVLGVDGRSVESVFGDFVARASAWEVTPELRDARRSVSVFRALLGAEGSTVVVRIEDESGRTRDLTLQRSRSSSHGALLPATFARVSERVGILRIPIWAGELEAKFDAALEECRTCDAMIIDLRGNVGGYATLLSALAGRLLVEDAVLSEWRYRDRVETLSAKGSGAAAFRGRVFVIIDGRSASSSELFAASLQDLGRARVVGTRSGGAVLPSLIEKLPTGGSLLYPIADAVRPSGERVEGRGVQPDVILETSRATLYAERDIVLEETIAMAER
ncbi:MAG TPA: S41 family peptidase [Thermoanaerobaculia bacterium]